MTMIEIYIDGDDNLWHWCVNTPAGGGTTTIMESKGPFKTAIEAVNSLQAYLTAK